MDAEVTTTEPDDHGMVNIESVRIAEPRTFGEQPCGAKRAPIRKPGWKCDGTNLAVVFEVGLAESDDKVTPVVLRRDLLPYVDDATFSALSDREVPLPDFAGGDHAHLVIPIPLPAPRAV